jgi:hypothetical protein
MWYDVGTISVTNGSTTVTGSGTDFISGVQVGEGLYIGGDLYEIAVVNSSTQLTLADAYLGSTATGQDYKIIPTQSLVADLSSGVADLISDFADVRDYAGSGKFDDGTATQPAITFTQDQNNGLYRIGSDNWGLVAGGTKQIDISTTDVELNYSGSKKLATTNTGVEVTGTVQADGLTVDGNVGIGTANPSETLSVAGSAYFGDDGVNGRLTIQSDTSQVSINSTDTGFASWETLRFRAADYKFITGSSAERARIDSSGNLLVGTTDANIRTSSTSEGVAILNDRVTASRNNGASADFNRYGNDGEIAQFRKDGSTVGSIGTVGADLTIGTGNTGMRFRDEFSTIQPHNTTTNGTEDGVVSLGKVGARFKDLYLSGGVYLGGTGSANKLDDYETGTWTPTIGSGTNSYSSAKYTKVGEIVTLTAVVTAPSDTTSGNVVSIGGLPFVANNSSFGTVLSQYIDSSRNALSAFVSSGSSSIVFYDSATSGGFNILIHSDLGSSSDVNFTMVYRTNS